MILARSFQELHAAREELGEVAFVPTMGAFHEGHLELMRRARETGFPVAISIFVNPLQFGPSEDFAQYPRDEAGDLHEAERVGVALAFLPRAEELVPQSDAWVRVGQVASRWEGAARPGHFDGVATIVLKLFHLVRPRIAYFGRKDLQQCAVIGTMVRDLNVPVELAFVETVREPSGLAMSSRNRRLTATEQRIAPRLYEQLRRAADEIASNEGPRESLRRARVELSNVGFEVDYIEYVDPSTLEPLATFEPCGRIVAAAKLGSVRLLDNVPVESSEKVTLGR